MNTDDAQSVETTTSAGDMPPDMQAPPPEDDGRGDYVPDHMDDAPDPDGVEIEPIDQVELDRAFRERNDSGNADRLVSRHGKNLIHVDRRGWHFWNGKIWDREAGENEVVRCSVDVARQIQGPEAEAVHQHALQKPPEWVTKKELKTYANGQRNRLRNFGVQSGNVGRLKAMAEVSKVTLSRPPDHMDQDRHLMTVRNGTITLPDPWKKSDADQVTKIRHKRSDYISRMAEVVYDPEAECPTWHEFLNAVQPNQEMQIFLQTYMGYCLTGRTTEQVLVVNFGGGANGKSTFVETIAAIMGTYATAMPVETFMSDGKRSGGEATPDLVRLPGVRMVSAAEPEAGSKLSESLVKQITGGEQLTARGLYQDQFTFSPHFKLVLSTNHKPRIYGTDDGIWRRILLIPWETTIPPEKRDRRLPDKLLAESSGIFNWLLDGARMAADGGLKIPKSVRAATDEYRQDSDPVGQFLEVCCDTDPAVEVSSLELFQTYERYCRANALPGVTQRGFNKSLQSKGFIRVKKSTMHWKGIKITDYMTDADSDSIHGSDDSQNGGADNDF